MTHKPAKIDRPQTDEAVQAAETAASLLDGGARSWFNLVTMAAGGASAILGIAVLVGWYTRSAILVQVHPAFVPMQYNTALGFLLCGLGLLSLVRGWPNLATALGATAAAIGSLTLIEYGFGVDLGIDQLLMEHYITLMTSHPGRMAPNTALGFILGGAALSLAGGTLRVRQHLLLAWILGTLVLALGLIAVSGYVSGVEAIYGWGRLTDMAFHTAVGFMLFGTGIFAFGWRENAAASVGPAVEPDIFGWKRIVGLALIMAVVALTVTGISIAVLYQASFTEKKQDLAETAKIYARLIEAVARFNREENPEDFKEARLQTIGQIKEGLATFNGSIEITIGRREADTIAFIVRQRAFHYFEPVPVRLDSPIAEPMRRALIGQSGIVIGLDYRSEKVLAAYEPVALLDLGIVVKTDLSEIRAPFIRAGLITTVFALVIIAIGTSVFIHVGEPMIRRLRQSEHRFRATFDQAAVGIAHVAPDGRFLGVNSRFLEIVGRSRAGFLDCTFQDITHPDDLELDLEHVRQLLADEIDTYSMEKRYIRSDQAVIWVNLTVSLVRSADGRPDYFVSVIEDISERKRAEQALQRSERRFHGVFDQSFQFVGLLEPDGKVLEINATALDFIHAGIDDVRGKFFWTTPWWSYSRDQQKLVREAIAAAAGGESVRFEAIHKKEDGNLIYLDVSLKPIYNGNGEVIYLIPEGRDVTERKEAEKALADHARQQSAVARLGMLALELHDSSSLMSEAVQEVAEVLQIDFCKILELLPDGQTLLMRAGVGWKEGHVGEATVDSGEDSQAGHTLRSLSPIVVEDLSLETRFSGPPLLQEHGIVSGMSVVIGGGERPFGVLGAHSDRRRAFTEDDVSFLQAVANVLAEAIEREAAEFQIRKLTRAIEQNLASILITDTDGAIEYINPAFEKTTGYTKEEILGKNPRLLKSGKTDPEVYRRLWQTITAGETWNGEFHNRKKSGELYWEAVSISPVKNKDGEITNYIGVKQDITEQKRTQEELRAREAQLSAIMESAGDGIVVTDAAGLITAFNPAAEKLFQYAPDEVMGKQLGLLMGGDDAQRHQAGLRRYLETGRSRIIGDGPVKATARRKDGSTFSAEISVGESNVDGKRTFIGVMRDVTERDQMQAQLIQASKLATLGEMATGMAHEMNQPLNVIRMASDSASKRVGEGRADPEFLARKFDRISAQTVRMAGIIDHMRIFGRKSDGEPMLFDPRTILTSSLGFISEQLRLHDIEVKTDLPDTCRQLSGHPNLLEQVLLNLFGNARDAIDGAGRRTADPKQWLPHSIEVKIEDDGDGEGVRILVGDTGGGIPEGAIDRVFEPFFTTKDPGKGTGLGLSISYGIVRDMGGTIEVANGEFGACFTITLPAATEKIEAAPEGVTAAS